MTESISPRNVLRQPKIFPTEMREQFGKFLQCAMAKRAKVEPQEIFLGAWLKLNKIGPTEAAKIAGCTQSYISNIMRGEKTNINALYLLKLSDHLGITVNDFFRKPPSEAQIAALSDFSPEARETLLQKKRQKAR